jgi:hypothetical protein
MVAEPQPRLQTEATKVTDEPEPLYKDEYWEIHKRLADDIQRQALGNPNSPYAGKYIGLLHGEVAVVADSPNEAWREMVAREPNPERRVVFEAGADYESVNYILEV